MDSELSLNSELSFQAVLMELAQRSLLERAWPGCDTVMCGFRMTVLPVRLFVIKQRPEDTAFLLTQTGHAHRGLKTETRSCSV